MKFAGYVTKISQYRNDEIGEQNQKLTTISCLVLKH